MQLPEAEGDAEIVAQQTSMGLMMRSARDVERKMEEMVDEKKGKLHLDGRAQPRRLEASLTYKVDHPSITAFGNVCTRL